MKAERDAYEQNWLADVNQKLSEQTQKLTDAHEQLSKAQLRRRLIELRADRDAIVLTLAKVSIGSVLQSGEQFITLVPTDAPLEVEVNISGRDDGFVHVDDAVAIKFDTFPFSQYGLAHGTVRTISADSFTAQDDAKTGAGSVPANAGSAEPFYRSRITLNDVQLHDLPAGFHIVPGMPVTADVIVGKHHGSRLLARPRLACGVGRDARAMNRAGAHLSRDRRRVSERTGLLDWMVSLLPAAAALRRAIRLAERGEAARAFPAPRAGGARAGLKDAEYQGRPLLSSGCGRSGQPQRRTVLAAARRNAQSRRRPIAARAIPSSRFRPLPGAGTNFEPAQ